MFHKHTAGTEFTGTHGIVTWHWQRRSDEAYGTRHTRPAAQHPAPHTQHTTLCRPLVMLHDDPANLPTSPPPFFQHYHAQ